MTTMEELYNEAYAYIDQGICYDEVAHVEGALSMYEKGLELIDRAGQLPNATQHPLYAKMAKAREHIQQRLPDLRKQKTNEQGEKKIYPDLYKREADDEERAPSPFALLDATIDAFGEAKSAEQLCEIGNAQIFYIHGEHTTVPCYPTSLKIFRFLGEATTSGSQQADNTPPAFLQVDDWVYPLVPGRSPTLYTEWGAYVFANPTPDEPELCVGLILPNDLDTTTKAHFDELLRQYTMFALQTSSDNEITVEERKSLSTKVAKFLVKSGEFAAWGVGKVAEAASAKIAQSASDYKMAKVADGGTKTVAVDGRLQTSVHYLRKGTKVAVKVSGYLVDALGRAALAIGQRAAKSVEKRLGGGEAGTSTTASRAFHSTIEVVGGGVVGAATVWMALEAAARKLGKDIANEGVQIIDVKYGKDAAVLADNAMHAAGHGAMAAWNVYELGPKAIAKRSARQAGVGLLKDLAKPKKQAIEAPPQRKSDEK